MNRFCFKIPLNPPFSKGDYGLDALFSKGDYGLDAFFSKGDLWEVNCKCIALPIPILKPDI